MLRTIGIILLALLSLHAVGQEQDGGVSRNFRGPGADGPPNGRREQRREMDQNAMLGKALRHPRVAEKLGLTQAQRRAIDERLASLEEAQIALRSELEKAALKQARLMMAEKLDEAALMAVVEETGRIHTEMAKLRIQHLLFMRQTLTPDQVEKARSIIREGQKQRHKQGSEEGGHRRWEFQRDQNRQHLPREQPESPPSDPPL